MNRFRYASVLFVTLLIAVVTSCSTKNIAYLQESKNKKNSTAEADTANQQIIYPRIKPNDKLFISVITPGSDAASYPFNLPLMPQKPILKESSTIQIGNNSIQNYIVDNAGEIMMPSIGRVKVAGLTRTELEKKIESLVYPQYITEKPPIVTVRITSFSVSVLGEVQSPGVINVESDRFSIFDALAYARDLTIYGDRKNVLLVREDAAGKKERVRLDLTSTDLMSSPYYYLQQNDIIYIQPNKTRANASRIGAAESLTVSIVGTLISLSSLIVTIIVAK